MRAVFVNVDLVIVIVVIIVVDFRFFDFAGVLATVVISVSAATIVVIVVVIIVVGGGGGEDDASGAARARGVAFFLVRYHENFARVGLLDFIISKRWISYDPGASSLAVAPVLDFFLASHAYLLVSVVDGACRGGIFV